MARKKVSKLKYETVSYLETTDRDFDDCVHSAYPAFATADWRLCAAIEAGNGTRFRFTAKTDPLTPEELKKFEAASVSDPYKIDVHLLAHKLCVDGYIDPGSYLVDVSW